MQDPVYLDNAATTPVDPRVAEAMCACLTSSGNFGNPASRSHVFGWRAEEAVENARQQLATLLGADPREIVWTSGATEADNLAIKGVARHQRARGRHLVTTAIEHKAVLDSCHALERDGYRITYLAPSSTGQVSPEQVEAALREDTVLVSVMHANNEIGSINDIASIGAVCRAHEVLFHVDAAQTVGKLPLDLGELPVDLLSIAAHKFYGPKGSGALYVRRQPPVYLDAQIHGGGHERGMRSGTLPCHQIVGLGAAAELAGVEMAAEAERLERFRQLLWQGLSGIGGVSLNGAATQRLPGLLNVSFAGVEGETLLLAVPDLAVSTGSACTSASLEPSYVLRAIGLPDELAHSSLRLSMGRFTSEAEVEHTVASLARALARLRGSEPACA